MYIHILTNINKIRLNAMNFKEFFFLPFLTNLFYIVCKYNMEILYYLN